MCHKPKAQLLADAPDTKEWRLRAKSCQAEDYAVVARGGTLQVIVCSGECRDACADILYDFQLQKAPCGSMELANTTAETHFDLEFERAIVESQKSPDHSAWASLWRAADTASGVADLIPTAWPSTNEVQREDKSHITDLGLQGASHISLIIYECAGKRDHKCPLCINAFATTCKVIHTHVVQLFILDTWP